jgi:hypothetical protein
MTSRSVTEGVARGKKCEENKERAVKREVDEHTQNRRKRERRRNK